MLIDPTAVIDRAAEKALRQAKDKHCHFCGKSRREVKGLIEASTTKASICNECVGIAVEILTKAGHL